MTIGPYSALLLAVLANATPAPTVELKVVGCNDNRTTKELLEFGKLRAQEQYSIDDPERFNELKSLANRLIKDLDQAYDKECAIQ